jgi:hypothetical protein
MPEFGLTIKSGDEMTRIQVTCPHQSGLIYIVPAERSWVCSSEQVPSHALAGFFGELVQLKDPKVAELMQSWGIYYRQLPLEADQVEADQTEAGVDAS